MLSFSMATVLQPPVGRCSARGVRCRYGTPLQLAHLFDRLLPPFFSHRTHAKHANNVDYLSLTNYHSNYLQYDVICLRYHRHIMMLLCNCGRTPRTVFDFVCGASQLNLIQNQVSYIRSTRKTSSHHISQI